MSLKVMVREVEGYSEEMLESMLHRTLFPSSFFNQPVLVRGVCFAAGADSSELARKFAESRLGLAIFSIGHETGTVKAWQEMSRVFTHPQTECSRMGVLLPHLDQSPAEVQELIAKTMLETQKVFWFPSATDFRKIIPVLRLALVVYLGLGEDGKMQVLIQPGQTLEIDKDSLKRAPRPNLN